MCKEVRNRMEVTGENTVRLLSSARAALLPLLLIFAACCQAQCPPGCDCRESKLYCNARHLLASPSASQLPAGLSLATFAQNNITTLEPAIFLQQSLITELHLEQNQLTSLSSGHFVGLVRLEKLFLQDNLITHLSTGLFSIVGNKLRILSLRGNRLNLISQPILLGLPWLEELDLCCQQSGPLLLEPSAFNGLTNLKRLLLSSNQLSSIPSPDFIITNLNSIRQLDLSDNNITSVGDGVFAGLRTLERLNLSGNSLSSFNEFSLSGLGQLNELSVSSTGLSVLDSSILGRVPNLQRLEASGNLLSEIPEDGLREVSGIHTLDLSYNNISELNATALQLSVNLTVLNLTGNVISNVDDLAFGNTTIRQLLMADNILSDVPSIALGWIASTLEALSLSSNNLTSLSDANFSSLAHLDRLTLASNELSSYPAYGFQLSNLTFLDLSDNSLALESDNFTWALDIPQLQYLNLSSNIGNESESANVSAGAFSGLTQLKELVLSNCNIEIIERDSMTGLSSLNVLQLHNNSLSNMPEPLVYGGMAALQVLNLSYNSIRTFGSGYLRLLPELQAIDLQHSGVYQVSVSAFQDQQSVRQVFLNDNSIQELELGVFRGLRPSALHLYNNPFRCLCTIQWLRTYVDQWSSVIPRADSILCSQPANVAGRILSTVPASDMLCVLPTVLGTLNSTSVLEGSSLDMLCNITGVPQPAISWTKTGLTGSVSSLPGVSLLSSGSILRFAAAQKAHEGAYTCRGSNSVGSTSTSVFITVLDNCAAGECHLFSVDLFDFPATGSAKHTSFGFGTDSVLPGASAGLLEGDLDRNTQRPVFNQSLANSSALLTANTTWPAGVGAWFGNTSQNMPLSASVRFDAGSVPSVGDGAQALVLQRNPFFPIDRQGFADAVECDGLEHNAGWTLHWSSTVLVSTGFNASSSTVVLGTHVITLETDLEAWLFVDGALAIDLGGLHGAACQHVIFEEEAGGGVRVDVYTGSSMTSLMRCSQAVRISSRAISSIPYNNALHRLDLFATHRTLCSSQIHFSLLGTGVSNHTSTGVESYAIEENVFGGTTLGSVLSPLYLRQRGVAVSFSLLAPASTPSAAASPFVVSASGTFGTVRYLDYEQGGQYLLTCAVHSNGSQAVLATVGLLVTVLDVNDNDPELNVTMYDAVVDEMREQGVVVATLNASDGDANGNAVLSFSIGNMAVTRVGYRDAATFSFTVTVADSDSTPGNSSVTASVQVSGRSVCSKSQFTVRRVTATQAEIVLTSHGYYMDGGCRRCVAGEYCPGDGSRGKCGCPPPLTNCSLATLYSQGLARRCSPCPEGSLCSFGLIYPCADGYYADQCSSASCPSQCVPCPAGSACTAGVRTRCRPGTFASSLRCVPCPRGTFSSEWGASFCTCCPKGLESSHARDACAPCRANEFSLGSNATNASTTDGSQCGLCSTCSDSFQCPCLQDSPCPRLVQCVNLVGDSPSYSCGKCEEGMILNGSRCDDINECLTPGLCSPLARCINTSPGFHCSACSPGFTGFAPAASSINISNITAQVCQDIDECLVNNGGCDKHAVCYNTDGSFYCGPCPSGYIGDGNDGCRYVDPCAAGVHSCHENAVCRVTFGANSECQCKFGHVGTGQLCGRDSDLDGRPDAHLLCAAAACSQDNCPATPNSGQEDLRWSGAGDACNLDDDFDNWPDDLAEPKDRDNCVRVANADQHDGDGDGVGDACDNCAAVSNPRQEDQDSDSLGDLCDNDMDNDGLNNTMDNCPKVASASQYPDADNDGLGDGCDNCPAVANADQVDVDKNGIGDVCESSLNFDADYDGVIDTVDNCRVVANSDQSNIDGDANGDACDTDLDGDGVLDKLDNCPFARNPDQLDQNGDGIGDNCTTDSDQDSHADLVDACPLNPAISSIDMRNRRAIQFGQGSSAASHLNWRVQDQGREVVRTDYPDGGLTFLLGEQRFRSFELSGTLYVKGENRGYVGLVFGHQSSRRFYLAMWKCSAHLYSGLGSPIASGGLSIRRVTSFVDVDDSTLSEDIWSTSNFLVWHDTQRRCWQRNTAYHFTLVHLPEQEYIRITIRTVDGVVVDSGDQFDKADKASNRLNGGRLGAMTFYQPDVIWSGLKIKCLEEEDFALQLDGMYDFVELPAANSLMMHQSFTISCWVKLLSAERVSTQPVLCTSDDVLCLFVQNGYPAAKMSGGSLVATSMLSNNTWHHLAIQFISPVAQMKLFVDGQEEGATQTAQVQAYQANRLVYVGCDSGLNFLHGQIDELVFWNIPLKGALVNSYRQEYSLLNPDRRTYVIAHYTANTIRNQRVFHDAGPNRLPGWVRGQPQVVRSDLALPRYSRRRKRQSVDSSSLVRDL